MRRKDPVPHPVRPEILVVADDVGILDTIEPLLTSEGFSVALAPGGKVGLRRIHEDSPAIVLSDIRISGVEWFEILRAARDHDPDLPVILMTDAAERAQAIKALVEGAFYYLQKPPNPEELVAVCRRALERRQLKLAVGRLEGIVAGRDPSLSSPSVADVVASGPARPERMAMERATLERVTKLVKRAVTLAPMRVLEQALSESSASGTLTDVVADMVLAEPIEGEWSAALLRGARVQRELLAEAGGPLSADKVGELLGIGRAAVDKRRRQGALLGLMLPRGDVVYPAAQFRRAAVLRGLPETLAAFRIRDPWMQLEWLLARDEALGGRNALEALAAGEVDRVRDFVAGAGDQGL